MLLSAEYKNFLAHNVKMLIIVGILTVMSRKNDILGLSESVSLGKTEFLEIFILMNDLMTI